MASRFRYFSICSLGKRLVNFRLKERVFPTNPSDRPIQQARIHVLLRRRRANSKIIRKAPDSVDIIGRAQGFRSFLFLLRSYRFNPHSFQDGFFDGLVKQQGIPVAGKHQKGDSD